MSRESYLPDLTNEAEADEARAELGAALDVAALAEWADRFGVAALNALDEMFERRRKYGRF